MHNWDTERGANSRIWTSLTMTCSKSLTFTAQNMLSVAFISAEHVFCICNGVVQRGCLLVYMVIFELRNFSWDTWAAYFCRKTYFQPLLYLQGANTAGSSTCLIFYFIFLLRNTTLKGSACDPGIELETFCLLGKFVKRYTLEALLSSLLSGVKIKQLINIRIFLKSTIFGENCLLLFTTVSFLGILLQMNR